MENRDTGSAVQFFSITTEIRLVGQLLDGRRVVGSLLLRSVWRNRGGIVLALQVAESSEYGRAMWFVGSYYWGSEDAISLLESTPPDWHGYYNKHVEPIMQE